MLTGWGRPDFYGDPHPTRQDRAEAWAWNQAQDRQAPPAAPTRPRPAFDRAAYDTFMDSLAWIVAPFKGAA